MIFTAEAAGTAVGAAVGIVSTVLTAELPSPVVFAAIFVVRSVRAAERLETTGWTLFRWEIYNFKIFKIQK
jgi:hypothetical protein